MCLSNLKVNLEFKNDLDQHLSILNEHLSLALEMEMEGVVEIVKECLRK
jgi:hypothetical protein